MFQKIYIINVSTEVQRREHVKQELEKIGWFNYEFINAVTGDELEDTDKLVERTILSETFIDPNGILTKNIIACSLSHKKAYSKFLEDGYESCLILEDDIRIGKDFLSLLINGNINGIINEQSKVDWDIFMWGLVGENIPHYLDTPSNLNYVREYKKYTPDYAAHAYQITREGAKKLLRNNTPVKFAADVNLETSECKIYCTIWSYINQHISILSRFETDNLEQSFKGIINQGFESNTVKGINERGSICDSSVFDIYFSPNRGIIFERKQYNCEISKQINLKSVEFKTYTDSEGNENKNWCHINL